MARADLLKRLFKSYKGRNDSAFLEAARELAEDERKKHHFALADDEIDEMARQGRDCDQPDLDPGVGWVKDSTVQSACFVGTRPSSFGWGEDEQPFVRWHIVVRSEPRLDNELISPQRYALVVSYEHNDQSVKLYAKVKARVFQRIRQNWG